MAKCNRKPGPGKEALKKIIREAGKYKAKAGFLETAKYEGGQSVAYIMAIQENGCPARNIPPRPVFGPTVVRNREKWRELMRQGAKSAVRGEVTVRQVLDSLGLAAVGEITKSIAEVKAPALKRATLLARMYRRKLKKLKDAPTKPLVDTGYLVSQVAHIVEGK